MYIDNGKRLYLRVGDRVIHKRYKRWGLGEVVELMTSELDGGACYARVDFNDGRKRVFNNDIEHYQCCYFYGVRIFDPPDKRSPSGRKGTRGKVIAPPAVPMLPLPVSGSRRSQRS